MTINFEEHVRRALDALPPDLASRLENVAVVVEDEDPSDPDLLGLFQEDPYLPAKVTIYRLPLEESFRTHASSSGRSGSRCSTSSPTTSGSKTGGSKNSATTDDDVPVRRRDRGRRGRRRPDRLVLPRSLGGCRTP